MAIVSESRDVRDFDEVLMEGHGEIFLEQGDREALTVEADEGLLPKIRSEVRGRRLTLGLMHWWDHLLPPWGPIRYRLTMKQVKGVSLSGAGALTATQIRTDTCQLKMSGSGRMAFGGLEATAAEVGISGSGKVEASGEVQRLGISISGSGNIDALDLASQVAEIRISGSGSIRVNVQQNLDVRISGSGSVKYRGQPQISQSISGSGSVKSVG
ncbi:MAG: DUF2807 domain-containing protein [Chloroflexi bacterium]|nr:DUF2807 domain-containing protein [Chloroflexota bacterium]